jgi:DNA-binding response OmpR family regulator
MDKEKFTQPRLRILLVEDEQDFAEIMKIRLAKEANPPLEITCVPTLRQALEAIAETTFDLVLLDLMLPDSGGIQTFVSLRAQARHTPIVIMSGLDSDSLAIDAVRKGAEDYLVKGEITARTLERSLRYALKLGETLEALRALSRGRCARHSGVGTYLVRVCSDWSHTTGPSQTRTS